MKRKKRGVREGVEGDEIEENRMRTDENKNKKNRKK